MPRIPLPIPPSIKEQENAAELVRCWFSEGELHVTLKADIGDPTGRPELSMNHKHASAWGTVLQEIASHASNALAGESDEEYWDLLRRIAASFQTEMISALTDDSDVEPEE